MNSLFLIICWILYFWSDTHGLDGNAGTFAATAEENVFLLEGCDVPAQGINFCVHSADWSTQYGWKSESVTSTGVEVELASASQASGWLALPAGKYDVTFNSSALTIRFDTVAAEDPGTPETPEDKPATFLIGGDMSMATYISDFGTRFYYENGELGDVFGILSDYGVNLVRLRLYHTPGTGVNMNGTTYRTPIMTPTHPEGYAYAGEEDILSLARHAKMYNMKICLSIYLSDFWSGATEQFIPAAWSDKSSLPALSEEVYQYVRRIMEQMVVYGATPEYVSIGNETNYGILYNKDKNTTFVDYGGHTKRNGWSNTAYLFNSAYDAVKDASPQTQVIIHHSYGDAGKIGTCRSFFQNLLDYNCKFDIVGGSYYPHWATDHGATDCTPTGMLEWAADMKTNIGKPVMLMEVGYSWHPYKCEGRNGGEWPGQLGLNGAYNEASKEGQAAFIKSLHEALDKDDNILGYMYWDPIFVDQKVNGSWIKTCWAEKYDPEYDTWWEDGNVISNTTLFDFEGKPLPALYREMASRKQEDTATSIKGAQNTDRYADRAQKLLSDGQLLIEREGKIYNAQGQLVR